MNHTEGATTRIVKIFDNSLPPVAASVRAVRIGVGGLIAVALLTCSMHLQASFGGRSGFSGDPSSNAGATCAVCHAPDGAEPSTIAIFGPDVINAGETKSLFVLMAGGPGQTAGVSVSVRDNVGTLMPKNNDLQVLNSELTHRRPKEFNDDLVAFSFDYTAPNYDAAVTLHAAGNSSNAELNLAGDSIATASRQIQVINGFEEPPAPPNPVTAALKATLLATGFDSPVAITHAKDERIFVVERGGRIRILNRNGSVNSQSFLDISDRVDDSASEMGLLGLAFHPRYQQNGYFYVYYTRDGGGGMDRSRVSRFRVSDNRNVANRNSEQVVLEFTQPFSNHNGGDLHFGPSGYLYISSGDGGAAGDPQNNSQTTSNLLGKILRIDINVGRPTGRLPDCNMAGTQNYRIPLGNAFFDGKGGEGCDEIYALGARNPWRFSFDRKTGAMWIGDVGQNRFEEVHYLPPGGSGGVNLGWRCFEGRQPYNLNNCSRAYLPPVHVYSHSNAGCSITGGYVYRGLFTPEFEGQYLFTDFCQSSVRALSGSPGDLTHRVVTPSGTLQSVSAFGEDATGEILAAELYTGNIYRLGNPMPPGC